MGAWVCVCVCNIEYGPYELMSSSRHLRGKTMMKQSKRTDLSARRTDLSARRTGLANMNDRFFTSR